MKKVLLGTTALVAAGVLAGGVQAAEKIKLGVGGYFNSAFGYVDEDDDDGESGDRHYSNTLNLENEIHFKGETTLENGITVGARVELEGFTSGDQVDERWVYFRGGFGELRYGDEDDARKLKSYAAPTPTPNTFGVNSPFFTFNNLAAGQVASTISTFRNLDNDAAKLIYFTPSFGGFQLAGSYAPDGQQDRTGFGTGSTQACGGGNQTMNDWSVGADYSGDFGGFTLGAGGGYSMGEGRCSDDEGNPWVGAGGVNVGFAGFTVGGSVLVGHGNQGDEIDETDFDVGITYTIDAITVGAGWARAYFDDDATDNDDTFDQAQIGASYALGPGISVDAMVGYFNYDADDSNNSNEGWQTGIGTAISF